MNSLKLQKSDLSEVGKAALIIESGDTALEIEGLDKDVRLHVVDENLNRVASSAIIYNEYKLTISGGHNGLFSVGLYTGIEKTPFENVILKQEDNQLIELGRVYGPLRPGIINGYLFNEVEGEEGKQIELINIDQIEHPYVMKSMLFPDQHIHPGLSPIQDNFTIGSRNDRPVIFEFNLPDVSLGNPHLNIQDHAPLNQGDIIGLLQKAVGYNTPGVRTVVDSDFQIINLENPGDFNEIGVAVAGQRAPANQDLEGRIQAGTPNLDIIDVVSTTGIGTALENSMFSEDPAVDIYAIDHKGFYHEKVTGKHAEQFGPEAIRDLVVGSQMLVWASPTEGRITLADGRVIGIVNGVNNQIDGVFSSDPGYHPQVIWLPPSEYNIQSIQDEGVGDGGLVNYYAMREGPNGIEAKDAQAYKIKPNEIVSHDPNLKPVGSGASSGFEVPWMVVPAGIGGLGTGMIIIKKRRKPKS